MIVNHLNPREMMNSTLTANARQLSAASQIIRRRANLMYLVSDLLALGKSSATFDRYLFRITTASNRVSGLVSSCSLRPR